MNIRAMETGPEDIPEIVEKFDLEVNGRKYTICNEQEVKCTIEGMQVKGRLFVAVGSRFRMDETSDKINSKWEIYVCQDTMSGEVSPNKLGYKHSWVMDNGVTDLELL